MTQRLNTFVARFYPTSRRKAEELIFNGLVEVNGMIQKEPFFRVDPKDKVLVDKQLIKSRKQTLYYALNKPRGFVCSERRFKQEKLVTDLFPATQGRLFTIGRLDKDSEGLILVTNDGAFANSVSSPKSGVEKEYIVKTVQEISHEHLVQLSKGGFVEGSYVRPKSVIKIRKGTTKVILKEGRKREIRVLFQKAGLEIVELKRVRIGNLQLGSLQPGQFKELLESETLAIIS
ncbi:rRNA pseudouridine synthase [bacterium]|jgi:23S rRNA pseudouridine2605 synthase|nr:rRNA pseudouridine synthase [Chlamydiota bacterium]NDD99085.1 rRNA pseudouridine synthase [bacterium]